MKNEQTETGPLTLSAKLLLAMAFPNKVLCQRSQRQASTFTEHNKIKLFQRGTYLKEILLEKEWEYLGTTDKF